MIYGRDFLTLLDFEPAELLYLVDLSIRFKQGKIDREKLADIHGKKILLLFEKPSTRTRMSLEVASYDLGLHPIYVVTTTTQLARGEPLEDFARVVDRYVDIIAARVYEHQTLEIMAKYANAPVINALSDKYHPLQAVADYMTIKEKFGEFKDLKIAFVGDTDNNVAHSLAIFGLKLGLEIRLVGPKEFWPKQEAINTLRELERKYGGKLIITDDPNGGLKDVDVVYTDVWVSMGQEKEKEKRLKIFRPYQVNFELVRSAKKDFIFMHCLPRHRGEEVSDDVFESKHSVVFDQAENRLHSAKAVIASIMLREKL